MSQELRPHDGDRSQAPSFGSPFPFLFFFFFFFFWFVGFGYKGFLKVWEKHRGKKKKKEKQGGKDKEAESLGKDDHHVATSKPLRLGPPPDLIHAYVRNLAFSLNVSRFCIKKKENKTNEKRSI